MPTFRTASFVAFIVGVALSALALAPAAAAVEPYRAYPASACLSGDAGPFDLVWKGDRNGGPPLLRLTCGLPTGTGVLHIDASHPIAEDGTDDTNLRRCANNIVRSGQEVEAANGNRALQIRRSDGGSATIVYQERDGSVVTMFTSDSNNWRACADFARV